MGGLVPLRRNRRVEARRAVAGWGVLRGLWGEGGRVAADGKAGKGPSMQQATRRRLRWAGACVSCCLQV